MSFDQSGPPRFPDHHELIERDEVRSTNSEALRLAKKGRSGPLWVSAKRQTGGKGRSGRDWDSTEGNLFASLLISLDCGPEFASQLSLIAGLAVFDATTRLAMLQDGDHCTDQGADQRAASLKLRLKWPNDGLIDGKKFAGILCESLSRQPGATQNAKQSAALLVVVGIGINLAHSPDALPRPVTDLRAQGICAEPMIMLAAVAQAFDHWLGDWQNGRGFEQIRTAWIARAGKIGEPMSIHNGAKRVTGKFAGIDETGALLLRDADGVTTTFSFGDVTLGDQADDN